MLGFVGLDEIQKLLGPLGLANCEGQSVIGRFEQIGMQVLRGLIENFRHRTDQRSAVPRPFLVERSFHGNRVNWLAPPRGGGRVVECERLLSA
jgi:hypothetical protein